MALKILLRFWWQTVNIGDIGETPGALRIFERQHHHEMSNTAGLSLVANP